MEIEIIKGIINNSAWVNPENQTIYKFAGKNELYINGENHLRYLLKRCNNQIVIKLGSQKKYFVEYVNDLEIYNDEELFRITPACTIKTIVQLNNYNYEHNKKIQRKKPVL